MQEFVGMQPYGHPQVSVASGLHLSDTSKDSAALIVWPLAHPGGPREFFKIIQFSGNFRENPHFEQMLGSGPPSRVKTLLAPTKILLSVIRKYIYLTPLFTTPSLLRDFCDNTMLTTIGSNRKSFCNKRLSALY